MALEKPSYTVLESDGNLELRRYEPYIVAETLVDGDFESAGNQGFRRLADYIFGNNRSRQKMEMTSPVSQAPSEKVAMTAPVAMHRQGDLYRITFMMPSRIHAGNSAGAGQPSGSAPTNAGRAGGYGTLQRHLEPTALRITQGRVGGLGDSKRLEHRRRTCVCPL